MARRVPALRSPDATTTLLVGGGLLAAVAVGLLSAVDPVLAAAAAVVLLGAPLVGYKPQLLAGALMVTILGESLGVGDITLSRLGIPLVVFSVVVGLSRGALSLERNKTLFSIALAYAVLAFSSLVWSIGVETTLHDLFLLSFALLYMLAIPLLLREPGDLKIFIWLSALASTVMSLWWIASYVAGVSRFTNAAGDPNFFAVYQVIVLPLVLVLAAHTKRAFLRGYLYAVMTLIALSVVSTLSRGGLLSLLVAGGLMATLPARALFRNRSRKALFLIIGALSLAAVLSVSWGDLSSRIGTEHGRLGLWRAAMAGYVTQPVTGIGFGAFEQVSFDLLRTTPGADLKAHSIDDLLAGRVAHNAYVGTLAELGPVGLALFIGLFFFSTKSLIATARRARAAHDEFLYGVANALSVGVVALALSSIFLSSEQNRIPWMMVGLALAVAQMEPHRSHAVVSPAETELITPRPL